MSDTSWDERYDREDFRYGMKPNAFLTEVASELPEGARVLCVGDGEGRNGVWLAEQGFAVTTVDASAVGVAKARKLAAARDVSVDIREGIFPRDLPPEEVFDAVVLIFIHLPDGGRELVHSAAVDRLAPGGCVILEAFGKGQLAFSSGGPPREDMLYDEAQLRSDFHGLELDLLEHCQVVLDEGPGHQGPGEVVRLLARRPVET